MSKEDDIQAANYRVMMQAREDKKLEREIRFKTNEQARQATYQDWFPLLPDYGWNPLPRVVTDDDDLDDAW